MLMSVVLGSLCFVVSLCGCLCARGFFPHLHLPHLQACRLRGRPPPAILGVSHFGTVGAHVGACLYRSCCTTLFGCCLLLAEIPVWMGDAG